MPNVTSAIADNTVKFLSSYFLTSQTANQLHSNHTRLITRDTASLKHADDVTPRVTDDVIVTCHNMEYKLGTLHSTLLKLQSH